MTTHRFAAFLLLVALAGCTTTRTTPVRIDGSTPTAFEASWKGNLLPPNFETQTDPPYLRR